MMRIVELMETDPDPFGFNDLYFIQQVEDSKRLNDTTGTLHHHFSIGYDGSRPGKASPGQQHFQSEKHDTGSGYCAPATLGARILRGDKEVSIFGNMYKVNADVERMDSYSGHADYSEMIQFLECQDKTK